MHIRADLQKAMSAQILPGIFIAHILSLNIVNYCILFSEIMKINLFSGLFAAGRQSVEPTVLQGDAITRTALVGDLFRTQLNRRDLLLRFTLCLGKNEKSLPDVCSTLL